MDKDSSKYKLMAGVSIISGMINAVITCLTSTSLNFRIIYVLTAIIGCFSVVIGYLSFQKLRKLGEALKYKIYSSCGVLFGCLSIVASIYFYRVLIGF